MFEAAEAAHGALALAVEPHSETWAQGRQAQAVRALFTFERSQLERADRLLQESLDVMPSAQAWAWRAFLRQTQILERIAADDDTARAEAEDYAHQALSFPGRNATVLALVSQLSAMISMDEQASFATAEESVALNPLSPYGQYALAAANLRAGRIDDARHHGQIAADTASNAHNGFFFQSISPLIALKSGDIDGCIRAYESITHRAPHFRPPLRGLIVLSLIKGDHDRTARFAAMLAKVETGFSLDRLLRDDRYPGLTLRSLGMLKAAAERI